MRIPVTPIGLREIVLSTIVLGVAGAVAAYVFWPLTLVPLVIWVWVLSFFRDPERVIVAEPGAFLSPADGTVTDVTPLANDPHIGVPATRIGIFLSVFSVHINRAPINGTVRSVALQTGACHDARSPLAISENAANTVVLDPDDTRIVGPVAVRQITGAIARRIVCNVAAGDRLAAGQRFGMIKFGSRTELIVPAANRLSVAVHPGQKVKAGLNVLARLQAPGAGPATVRSMGDK